MEQEIYERFRKVVYEHSGISLGDHKKSLVCARIGKRMRELNLKDYADYLGVVEDDNNEREIVQLLDKISTNVTSFFREPAHFDFLADRMKEWLVKGQERFRIWSAASSTGEEPYSMAMTLNTVVEEMKMPVDVKILATDISTEVLSASRNGYYRADKVKKIPGLLKDRFFNPIFKDGEKLYQVNESLKRDITFSRLNLSKPPFPMEGPFDVVFCRNVMIYFDNDVRKGLLDEIYRLLKPDGFLMVGHAESLAGMLGKFKNVRPSTYTK
ncbi:MAG: methyltransferase domain-containing protein [Bacteriovoracaceae bacterium]|nr:methyltransferase domain-containing protein [Bacteriovoracaceae bacterium]